MTDLEKQYNRKMELFKICFDVFCENGLEKYQNDTDMTIQTTDSIVKDTN